MQAVIRDDDPILNQVFTCLSFMSPHNVKGCSTYAIKVRGVYATLDEAQAAAKKISEQDPQFDVFVGNVGSWLPWNPDPSDQSLVANQQFQEEQLQMLVDGHNKQHEESKKIIQQQMADAKEYEKNLGEKRRKKRNKKRGGNGNEEKKKEQSLDDVNNVVDMEKELAEMENMYATYQNKVNQ